MSLLPAKQRRASHSCSTSSSIAFPELDLKNHAAVLDRKDDCQQSRVITASSTDKTCLLGRAPLTLNFVLGFLLQSCGQAGSKQQAQSCSAPRAHQQCSASCLGTAAVRRDGRPARLPARQVVAATVARTARSHALCTALSATRCPVSTTKFNKQIYHELDKCTAVNEQARAHLLVLQPERARLVARLIDARWQTAVRRVQTSVPLRLLGIRLDALALRIGDVVIHRARSTRSRSKRLVRSAIAHEIDLQSSIREHNGLVAYVGNGRYFLSGR